MTPRLTFDSVVWMPLAIAIASAAFLGCVAAYAALSRRELRWGARTILIILRTVSLLAVAMLLLRPAWLIEESLREKLGLVLLADASQSMTIRDGAGGKPRLQIARQILTRSAPERRLIARKYDFKEFAFGREIADLSLDRYNAEDQVTAIGDALSHSLQQITVGNVAGVVLLSDGANNYGRDPEAVARDLGARKVPIYPIVIGEKEIGAAIKDVKVTSLNMSPVAFTRNNVPITAELSFICCDGERVALSLWVEEKEIVDARKAISVRGQDMKTSAEFLFVPDAVGPKKITVRAEPVNGEINTANNAMSSYMHILSGGLKVLYIDRPRAEFKFLRQAFATYKDIQLDAVATLGEKVTRPAGEAEWRQYDVVIIGDVKSSAFDSRQLKSLESAVSNDGVGFGMIAGTRNFAAGGYAATPVAYLLPVTMPIGQPEKQFEGEYHLLLTPTGGAHFMLLLEKDIEANKKAWSELRPLSGGVEFGAPKPAAQILAVGPDGQPILVVQRYGKGRTMAFASDSTWRWALAEKDTVKYHRRFWRQVLLWLGNKENLGRANVWISLPSLRVIKGERIDINANVEDSLGQDIADARLQAEIIPPQGRPAPLRFHFEEDRHVCTYRPEIVGDYEIILKAFASDGSLLGEDTAKFLAYVPDVELENPFANADGMRRLASISGGELYGAEQAGDLFRDLAKRDSTIEIKRTVLQPLWSARWVLYIFLIALTLEWTIRKLQRLI